MRNIEEGFKTIPADKQKALRKIVHTIHQCVKPLRYSVEMIILFGSYARGEWVENLYKDNHITYNYQSDFD